MNKIEKLTNQLEMEKNKMEATQKEIQEKINKEWIRRENEKLRMEKRKEAKHKKELTIQNKRLVYYQDIEQHRKFKAKMQTFPKLFPGSGSSQYLVIKLFALVDFMKEEIEELECRIKKLETK